MTSPLVNPIAEALAAHQAAVTRSDLTVVCDCGFDCDPCHWGDPWTTHKAESAADAVIAVVAALPADYTAVDVLVFLRFGDLTGDVALDAPTPSDEEPPA